MTCTFTLCVTVIVSPACWSLTHICCLLCVYILLILCCTMYTRDQSINRSCTYSFTYFLCTWRAVLSSLCLHTRFNLLLYIRAFTWSCTHWFTYFLCTWRAVLSFICLHTRFNLLLYIRAITWFCTHWFAYFICTCCVVFRAAMLSSLTLYLSSHA